MSSSSPPKDFRLGVLMVHGMGAQPARHTLVDWGDTLLEVIRDATKRNVRPTAYRASSGDGTADDPAEVEVEMRNGERWLLTEAWWADAFPPPSFFELVTWGFRAIPWTLSVHAAQSYWSTTNAPWYEKWWKRSFVFAWLLAAPLALVIMALTMLVGLLPIESVRTVARAVQSTLTTTIGDSLVFVESPTRAALIRARVIARLEELSPRCDHTIVIAHSQGAAVVLDALGGIVHGATDPPPDRRTYPTLDTLVTFGAGINPLASLIVLRDMRTTLRAISVTPNQTILGLFATLGVLGYIGWSVWAGRIALEGLVEGLALSLFTPVVAFVSIAIIARGRKRANAKASLKDSAEPSKLSIGISVAVLLAAVAAAIAYAELRSVPFGWLNLGLVVCFTFIGGTVALLSRSTRQLMTRVVRMPPGVRRWVDLYASNDPVPNGEVRVAPGRVEPASIPISNRGSLFLDHNAYWQNLDEFVLRVARECASTAKSDWRHLLPAENPETRPRAARRVRFRRWASALNLAGWVAVAIALRPLGESKLPSLFDLLEWHPPGSEGHGPLASYIVLASAITALTSLAIGWLWRRWVRTEQAQVIDHETPKDPTFGRFLVMGCVIGCVMPVIQVLIDLGKIETAFQDDPLSALGSIAAMIFGAGVFIGLILWVAWKFAGLFTWPDSKKPPAPPDAHAKEPGPAPSSATTALAAPSEHLAQADVTPPETKSSGSFPKPKIRANDPNAHRKRSRSVAKPSAPTDADEATEEVVPAERSSAKKRR